MVKSARASPKPRLCQGGGSMVTPPAQVTNTPVMGEHGDGKAEGRNEPNPGGVLACRASMGGLGKLWFILFRDLSCWLGWGSTGERKAAKSTLHGTNIQDLEGREVLHGHECCWLGGCRAGFGKHIPKFKGGKAPKPKPQV